MLLKLSGNVPLSGRAGREPFSGQELHRETTAAANPRRRERPTKAAGDPRPHITVSDLARFLGLSMLKPFANAT